MPSPRKPTVLPCSCNREMIWVFCKGVSLENNVVSFTASFNVVSSISSISTPCTYNCSIASVAEGLGGSRKARYPINTISFSSSMAKLQSFSMKLFWETANTLIPCRFISSLSFCAFIFKESVKGCISPSNSAYEQTSRISSTAPLVIICRFPCLSSITTDILLRVKSKGISSTLV